MKIASLELFLLSVTIFGENWISKYCFDGFKIIID